MPIGDLGYNPQGEMLEMNQNLYSQTSFRAIIDVGVLDSDPKYLLMQLPGISIIGSSSDMIVLDLGENPHALKVGDTIPFGLKYMGALSLMNSNYVEKVVAS